LKLRPPVTGVAFASRHGDELTMWALFEQPNDGGDITAALAGEVAWPLSEDISELDEALRIHGLVWADD
jgi:hypothetical protein